MRENENEKSRVGSKTSSHLSGGLLEVAVGKDKMLVVAI